MLILDKPRPYDGRSIQIPLYHRGHLSLFPGARVWVCLLPGSRTGSIFPELVIAPIHFDFWSDLWRISVTLFERAGLVHDVFEVLREHSINILAAESSSMEWQKLHSLDVIVDACRYGGAEDDGSHQERSSGSVDTLPGLRRAILAQVMNDISFDALERPRLRIRRIQNLFEARGAFSEAQKEFRAGGLEPAMQDVIISKSGKRVAINLPAEIRRSLSDALEVSSVRSKSQGKYLLVSETTDRFLRAFFIRTTYPLVCPTFLHKEEVGALAAITGAVERAGFNIVTSLSRLNEHRMEAKTEFVLQPTQGTTLAIGEEALKARLEDALSTPDLVETYGLRVAYPEGYKSKIAAKALRVGRGLGKTSMKAPQADTKPEATEAKLGRLYHVYYQRSRSPRATHLDRLRLTLAANLVAEENVARGSIDTKVPLFVSYCFSDEERFRRIQNSARSRGFSIITGKRLGGESINRDGIRRLMQECTHFLGVWSEDGGIRLAKEGSEAKKKETWWPSPWLHWELGVAEALGLKWRLLISDAVEPLSWMKLASNTPHEIFTKAGFDRSLRASLQALRSIK